MDLKEFRAEQDALDFLTPGFCSKYLVLPLKINGKSLTLATADPMDGGMISDLQFITGLQIEPVMANVQDIPEKVKDAYRGEPDPSKREPVASVVTIPVLAAGSPFMKYCSSLMPCAIPFIAWVKGLVATACCWVCISPPCLTVHCNGCAISSHRRRKCCACWAPAIDAANDAG